MRDREKKWRKKHQAQGRKQIACWLDGDTYAALQALIAEKNLRGMGEAIRLLVDNHPAPQETPHAPATLPPLPSIRFTKTTAPGWSYDAAHDGEVFAEVRRTGNPAAPWEARSSRDTALLSALRPLTGRTREEAARAVLAVDC